MEYNYRTKQTCPICGKTDFCGTEQGQNGVIAYCGRVRAEKGKEITAADGNVWVSIRPDGDMYCGWALKANEDAAREKRRQEWIEEQKRNNPNWKLSKSYSHKSSTPTSYMDINPSYKDRSGYKKDLVDATTDSGRLNRVYTALLSCLVLEPEHEKALKDEWGSELFATLTSLYPIKSLPMDDFERFSYGKFSKSPQRKAIIEQMHTLGITKEEMIGVPGFYENSKTGKMTLYRLSGIVFPVYDGKGNIVRIRIKDDFPSAKGIYHAKEGHFYFSRKDMGWCFQAEGEEPELVYQPKSKTYKVKLDGGTAGVPLSHNGKSKIEGKYKNFSSCKELYDDENKVISNYFKNGAQSGSFPSIYTQKGDNTSIVFFTEGEKKAMVANKLLGYPVVCFPGVGTFKKAFESLTSSGPIMDDLIRMGMKKAVLAYDADKTSNVHVLQAEKNCVQWFLEHHIAMAIGEWDKRYGKGLDDVLLKGIRPILYDVK